MGYYNFDNDYKKSETCAKESIDILKILNTKLIGTCHTEDYDIKVQHENNIEKTIEIKEDFECHKTGNIAVEHQCRGKKSGIEVTKADFYIYKVHESDGCHFYLMKTSELKRIIKDIKYVHDVWGGDPGSGTKMYLFRLEEIQKISVKLK